MPDKVVVINGPVSLEPNWKDIHRELLTALAQRSLRMSDLIGLLQMGRRLHHLNATVPTSQEVKLALYELSYALLVALHPKTGIWSITDAGREWRTQQRNK